MEPTGYHYLFKITLLGASETGKSTLLINEDLLPDLFAAQAKKQINNEAEGRRRIQADFEARYVSGQNLKSSSSLRIKIREYILNRNVYRIQYWDTPGADKHLNLTEKYCTASTAIILVFDLTDTSSFERVCDWLAMLERSHQRPVKVLVGNKVHSKEKERVVPKALCERLATQYNMKYIETDALEGTGATELFQIVFFEILKMIPFPPEPRDMQSKSIKLGPLIIGNKIYKQALFDVAQNVPDDFHKQRFTEWL